MNLSLRNGHGRYFVAEPRAGFLEMEQFQVPL